MNLTVEKYPATGIENKTIELFNELDVLGMYVYVRMLIDFETTTVSVIIDRIIEKFKVDHEFVLIVLKKFEEAGLLMIVKTKD